MATEKTKRWWPAILHAVAYGMPFLAVTRSPAALAVIVGTHAVIDRYRLARVVVWLKNFLAPVRRELVAESAIRGQAVYAHYPRVWRYRSTNPQWKECSATGYPKETPAFMAVWLLILADNIIHMLINVAAVVWL